MFILCKANYYRGYPAPKNGGWRMPAGKAESAIRRIVTSNFAKGDYKSFPPHKLSCAQASRRR